MAQRRSRFGLLHEAPLALRIGHLFRRQHLDGDEAVQMGVAGFVHDSHPPFAQLLEDLVMSNGPADHQGHRKVQVLSAL